MIARAGTIAPDSLPGDLKLVAEVAGSEAAIRLAFRFGGTYLYVPALDEFRRIMRDEDIRVSYDQGVPARKLASIFHISIRSVRRILKEPSCSVFAAVLREIVTTEAPPPRGKGL